MGIPAYEDKLVQKALAKILNAIEALCESDDDIDNDTFDFLGFTYYMGKCKDGGCKSTITILPESIVIPVKVKISDTIC